jgi:SAM-dependent methyltransferase
MAPIPKSLQVEEELPQSAFTGMGVFTPTATTRALCQQALTLIEPGNKALDLGCGSGIIGLEIARRFNGSVAVSMSDVSTSAVARARSNAASLGVVVEAREGSMFQPWLHEQFDVIVSDVSGVIPELGTSLGWFDSVPNDSGDDGVGLAGSVVSNAPAHLTADGLLLMPIISLSNEKVLLERMHSTFRSVQKLLEVRLPIPGGADIEEMERRHPSIRIGRLGRIGVFFATVWKMADPREAEAIDEIGTD